MKWEAPFGGSADGEGVVPGPVREGLSPPRRAPRVTAGDANCSRWSTTGCATATSARSTVPGRREQSGRNRARPPFCLTPEPSAWSPARLTPRVVTAPLHAHTAGRRDDRQPDQSGPAPTQFCAITAWRRPTTYTVAPLIFRHPTTACTGPAQRQDPTSSLRCGRSVLTPALTQCCLHGGRKPAKPLLNNLLTHPAPSGMTMPDGP